ncbi:hypothetical protein Q0N71_14510 [Bacillus thuringiensis]|uniref:hypothetical protein n=1 Tax=Bacillus thuringiensis TaxID=1428 RepID=UPI00345835A2
MEFTFQKLEACFKSALNDGVEYVGVLIEMEGFDEPEIIINHRMNISDKLDYYGKTYDVNLNHKFANGIRIVGFTYGDSFADIQHDLIG